MCTSFQTKLLQNIRLLGFQNFYEKEMFSKLCLSSIFSDISEH